jgi:hypothetical protein
MGYRASQRSASQLVLAGHNHGGHADQERDHPSSQNFFERSFFKAQEQKYTSISIERR